MPPSIALVSTADARPLDDDLQPLRTALESAGAKVGIADWDDESVDWSQFDLAVLRSPWNYAQHVEAFTAWLERAAARTRIVNPPAIVRWNLDKHYLAELAKAGVATVPCTFVEQGNSISATLDAFLAQHAKSDEMVVKPAIGAGSRDAQRHARQDVAAIRAHMRKLLDAGRSVLLQPYLDRVDSHGETALMFFDGTFSHAIRKGPLLQRGAESTRLLFAEEEITARTPSPAEFALAHAAIAAVPNPDPLAYARVDLIQNAEGAPVVLELELAEPSLFFAHSDGSAKHLAEVLMEHAVHASRS